MGKPLQVYGVKALDEKWVKMKKIWDLCVENKVEIPSHVFDYFHGEYPTETEVIVDLKNHESVTIYENITSQGFEIDVEKLPNDIKKIRIVNLKE